MLHKQHKFLGDQLKLGNGVSLPGSPGVKGRIVFSQTELIESARDEVYDDLKTYNANVAAMSQPGFILRVIVGDITAQVRRSFGDVCGWAGDIGNLKPEDASSGRPIQLLRISDEKNATYVTNATTNWNHFMPTAYTTWRDFHEVALRLAAQFAARRDATPAYTVDSTTGAVVFDMAGNLLAKALFFEAYGCHFLQDCFTSGHLRTPRLLFGDDIDAFRAMDMHAHDNEARLSCTTASGDTFRLVGEDKEKDDFRNMEGPDAKQQALLKTVRDKVVQATAISVQQVLDAAFAPAGASAPNLNAVKDCLPILDVSWSRIEPADVHHYTHVLEIGPRNGGNTPPPLYKFQIEWDAAKGRFIHWLRLMKLTDGGEYRPCMLGLDERTVALGTGNARWIPADVNGKKSYPADL
jgi:hypothetical protein